MGIREQLREFIIENFLFGSEENGLNDDDSFLETGIIDSTGILELVAFIEEKFEFEVNDEDLIPDNFDSVNKLISYIENNR